MSEELKQAIAAAASSGIINNGCEPKNLPAKKRKKAQESVTSSGSTSPVNDDVGPRKRGRPKDSTKWNKEGANLKSDEDTLATDGHVDAQAAAETRDTKPIKREVMSKSREIRLEQNRKAARESRRRKKVMVEELQRSVIFFSRANSTLKQQNDELQQLFVQAQAQIQTLGQNSTCGAQPNEASAQPGATTNASAPSPGDFQREGVEVAAAPSADATAAQQAATAAQAAQQAQAQAAQGVNQYQSLVPAQAPQATAVQAMYESQGFPPAAARAAAQTYAAGTSGVAAGGASVSSSGDSAPQGAPSSVVNAQQQLQNPQAAAALAANPFMAAMMGIAMPHNVVASAPAPGGRPGATPSPMDAFNQFAMQQQFAAQLSAMGGAMPNMAAANPMLLQQQAAAMQQMTAAAGGQWGTVAGTVQGSPAPAPGAQATGQSM